MVLLTNRFSAKEKYHAWKVLELGVWIAGGMLLGGVKGHAPLFFTYLFFPPLGIDTVKFLH